MGWITIISVIIGIGVAGYVGWISVQSLMQARLLRQAAGVGMSGMGSDRPVALYGKVRVLSPLRKPSVGNCLWCHVKHQEYRGWGRNRRWRTVQEEVETAQFVLEFGDREVRIIDHPTEVQSARRETQYPGTGRGGGFLESMLTGAFARERTISEWLPVLPHITVLGRLESYGDDLTVVKSPKMGLLFSPHEPTVAARQETMKGIAGLVLVGFGLVAGIWYLNQVF